MPARAPGFRAMASAADPATRPCPMPQRPEAIPMPIPAPIGTQLGAEPPVDCANAGEAMQSTLSVMKRYCSLRIRISPLLPLKCAVSGWLRLTVLAPSRSRPALPEWVANSGHGNLKKGPSTSHLWRFAWDDNLKKSMLLRSRFCQINHGQQHKHIRLNQCDAEVQSQKDDGNRKRDQREEDQCQQIAGKHVRVKADGKRHDARQVRDDLNRKHQRRQPPHGSHKVLQIAD